MTGEAEAHVLAALEAAADKVRSNGSAAPSSIAYVDWHELFTKPPQPPLWHAKPLVAAGRITLLYSPGKVGKSLIAMETALAAATGMPVLATPAKDPVNVLYIDQEMTQEDWLERLTGMGYGPSDAPLLTGRLHLAQLQPWLPMDTYAGGAVVAAEAERIGAELVIIDTASKVSRGEENQNDTHQAFYRNTVVPLKRMGMSALVLDHTGKEIERGARGGSAKTDNVDLAFELLTRGRDLLTLRCTHARFRDEMLLSPVLLRRTIDPLRHEIEARPEVEGHDDGGGLRPTVLMGRVSDFLAANPGVSHRTIVKGVRGREEYVEMALDVLIAEGFVVVTKVKNRHTHQLVTPFSEDPDEEGSDQWHS